jgi:hypothetical protein
MMFTTSMSQHVGAPLLAICHTLWYRPMVYYTDAPWRSQWAEAGGGVAMTMSVVND